MADQEDKKTTPLVRGALITGGVRRLGAVFAERLAQDGFALVLHHNSDPHSAAAFADSLKSRYKIKATCLQADLSKDGAAEKLFADATDALGGVPSVVVANAALFVPDPAGKEQAHHAETLWNINYEAPIVLTHCQAHALKEAYLPAHRKIPHPVMIYLGDATLQEARDGGLRTYAATKEALMAKVASQALACAPDLRVVALAPGPCLVGVRQSDAHFHALAKARPLQIATKTQELAAGLAFLVEASSVSGEILYLDGGAQAKQVATGADTNTYGVEIIRLTAPCRIGWTEAERAEPQTLQLSLRAVASIEDKALRGEDLREVIDYSALEGSLRDSLENFEGRLLERLASEMLDKIFALEPRLSAATLTLSKPDLREDCAYLGISLTRQRTTP